MVEKSRARRPRRATMGDIIGGDMFGDKFCDENLEFDGGTSG